MRPLLYERRGVGGSVRTSSMTVFRHNSSVLPMEVVCSLWYALWTSGRSAGANTFPTVAENGKPTLPKMDFHNAGGNAPWSSACCTSAQMFSARSLSMPIVGLPTRPIIIPSSNISVLDASYLWGFHGKPNALSRYVNPYLT